MAGTEEGGGNWHGLSRQKAPPQTRGLTSPCLLPSEEAFPPVPGLSASLPLPTRGPAPVKWLRPRAGAEGRAWVLAADVRVRADVRAPLLQSCVTL